MGDYDCYCALCAAPFHCYDPFNARGLSGGYVDLFFLLCFRQLHLHLLEHLSGLWL